jgi:hypothetical protein
VTPVDAIPLTFLIVCLAFCAWLIATGNREDQ